MNSRDRFEIFWNILEKIFRKENFKMIHFINKSFNKDYKNILYYKTKDCKLFLNKLKNYKEKIDFKNYFKLNNNYNINDFYQEKKLRNIIKIENIKYKKIKYKKLKNKNKLIFKNTKNCSKLYNKDNIIDYSIESICIEDVLDDPSNEKFNDIFFKNEYEDENIEIKNEEKISKFFNILN